MLLDMKLVHGYEAKAYFFWRGKTKIGGNKKQNKTKDSMETEYKLNEHDSCQHYYHFHCYYCCYHHNHYHVISNNFIAVAALKKYIYIYYYYYNYMYIH